MAVRVAFSVGVGRRKKSYTVLEGEVTGMFMLGIAISVNGVEIRLTEERWQHIIQQHPEMSSLQATVLNTVENPEKILAGRDGQLIAVQTIKSGKWLLVVYRELVSEGVIVDGFIVTAFFNRRSSYLEGKEQIWP